MARRIGGIVYGLFVLYDFYAVWSFALFVLYVYYIFIYMAGATSSHLLGGWVPGAVLVVGCVPSTMAFLRLVTVGGCPAGLHPTSSWSSAPSTVLSLVSFCLVAL